MSAGEAVVVLVLALAGLSALVLELLEILWPTRQRGRGISRAAPLRQAGRAEGPLPDPAAALRHTRDDTTALRECRDFFRRDRFAEAVAAALAVLIDGPTGRPAVTAALWDYVGLSRQALRDFDGARVAFEAAMAAVPEFNRTPHRRYLAALTLTATRAFRLRAQMATEPEERVRRLRAAVGWARLGLETAPADPSLRHLLGENRAALGAAWETAGKTLLGGGDLTAARRLLNDALADPELPTGAREALLALLARATPADDN